MNRARYDPRRGIMHHDRDDADAFALAFDVMEPCRPVVDAVVLEFLRKHELTGADFVLRTDGVCRLVPQLARHIAERVVGWSGAQTAAHPAGGFIPIVLKPEHLANLEQRAYE